MDKILSTLADTIQHSLIPVMKSMYRKLDMDVGTHNALKAVSDKLRTIEQTVGLVQVETQAKLKKDKE